MFRFMNNLKIALIGATLMTLGCAIANAKTLSYATWQPEASSSVHTQAIKWFNEQLKKRTDGKDSLHVYWGGTVAGIKGVGDAVQSRLVDMGDLVVPYFPSRYRLNNGPGSFWPQPNSPLKMGQIMQHLLDRYPQFSQELARDDLKVLAIHPLGPYGMLCKKPIRTMADFKGVRIRSYGEALPAVIDAIGAVPVPISTVDTYQGLQRGVVDCAPIMPVLGHSWKYDEVTNYFIDVPLGPGWGQYVVINKELFNSLSSQLQKTLTQIGKEFLTYYTTQLKERRQKVFAQWKARKNFHIIKFPREQFLSVTLSNPEVQSVRDRWIEYAKSKGLPAEKIARQFNFKNEKQLIKTH